MKTTKNSYQWEKCYQCEGLGKFPKNTPVTCDVCSGQGGWYSKPSSGEKETTKNMNQIKTFDGLVGKIIKRFVDADNKIFLFFEDNSFAVIGADGWEEHYPVLRDAYNIEPNRYNIYELLSAGFINETTYNELKQKYMDEDRRRCEALELQTLKQLKEKYPNG